MGAASSVVLLTEDRENARRARDQDGLVAISLVELADRVDGDDADLRERIRRAASRYGSRTVSGDRCGRRCRGRWSVAGGDVGRRRRWERGDRSRMGATGHVPHMHMLHATGGWC
eukprot:ctg_7150.g623